MRVPYWPAVTTQPGARIADVLAAQPGLTWVEVVAESVMHGMPPALRQLRERGVTVVPHGVKLGLGDAEGLDVEVPAAGERSTRQTVVIRTTTQAVTATVDQCTEV